MLCFRETAFGRVGIEDKEGSITRLYLPGRSDAVSEGPETALLGEAFAQLEAYFAGRRKTFDLPLRFDEGTPFMKQVWQDWSSECAFRSEAPRCGIAITFFMATDFGFGKSVT